VSRSYRQIGVIVGAAVVILVFILGILEKIPWNYAIGAITVTGVIAAIIKLYPSKVEPERKEVVSFLKNGEMTKTGEQLGETEPFVWVKKNQKSALLPDNTEITKLNIDDSLLDEIYEKAQREAIKIYRDAQLSGFSVQVLPFGKAGRPIVNVYYDFYSKWADRICHFQFSELSHSLKHYLPNKRPIADLDTEAFANLPWKTSPHWMQFLSRSYDRIKPLPPVEDTCYNLYAKPTQQTYWIAVFQNGLSGDEHSFEWDGRRLDENGIKQLR